MTNVPINIGTLPAGFCPATWQAAANGFGQIYTVDAATLAGVSGTPVVVQSTKPSNTSVIWKRIDSLGRPVRDYYYAQGAWLSLHPQVPGQCIWWFAVLPNFTTFDGGDSSSIGDQSGPMWQQAKDGNGNIIAAQFPVTAGTLPGGATLVLNDTGGEDLHVLTVSEGGQDAFHRHFLGRFSTASGGGADDGYFFTESSSNTTTGNAQRLTGGSGSVVTADISTLTGNYMHTGIIDPTPVATAGHNTLPPYVVGYLLQRTARLYYAVT